MLTSGNLVALGSSKELRREAFGGEPIELVLGGGPADAAGRLRAVEKLATSVKVQGEGDDYPRSRERLLVDDAEAALPEVLASRDGIRVRSAGFPKVSCDEVFFRLMKDRG